MTTIDLPIAGMTCANCANTIERTLKKTPGVSSAAVNYASERAQVVFDSAQVKPTELIERVRKAGYDVPSVRSSADNNLLLVDAAQAARDADIADRRKRMMVGLAFAVPTFLLSMSRDFGLLARLLGQNFAPMQPDMGHAMPIEYALVNAVLFVLTLPVMLYTAKPYFAHGYTALRNGAANMDVLIALGSGVAFVYSLLTLFGVFTGHVYFETAAMIVALISIGKYIEVKAKGRTSAAIKSLMNLAPKTARVVRDGNEMDLPIAQINVGEIILVKPGERIATDGIVIDGCSAVDESMITGESVPRDKKPGDNLIGATVNKEGLLKFEASKVGKDTALANIIRLVEQAQGSKAPIQALADKVSAVFVPAVLVIAALTFLGWLLIGRVPFEVALINAISVLVIACPCALGLATPTAIMVGMGKGAEHGILFKSSTALERAAEITTVVLDKTGTMTQGKPVVTDVLPLGAQPIHENSLLAMAASAEKGSEHPLAHAIVQAAETRQLNILLLQKFSALPGKGLTAHVDGQQVSVGNLALMQQQGIRIADEAHHKLAALQTSGKTAMFVAINQVLVGIVAMSDVMKDGSVEAIGTLKQRGIRSIMLTGDNARSAQTIAQQAGVDEVIADVLPEQKAEKIRALQNNGRLLSVVAMVGDGINDAPALAQADVGMAIGTGTDVAMEASDITLISGDIRKVAQAIALSKLTVHGIKQNLFWAFFYNVILIPLAIAGVFQQFGPILAAGAMAFSSLFVVSNSLRLRQAKI